LPDELQTDRWLLPVLGRLVIVASLVVSIVEVRLLGDTRFTLPAEVEPFGVVLLFVGIGLDIAGRLSLRKFYSETVRIRPDHKLITHGVYRFIRHPIYLGVLLYAFSLPLILQNLLGFLITMALTPMLIIRIRLEEKVLADRFGQEYAEYARKTKRLIPYVY
jgi:protein-S-isoprenylcysteine O-methyltransferase